MTQALIALDLVLVLLVAGLWLAAGILIATLAQEPTPARVRRAARIALALVTGGILAFFLRVCSRGALWPRPVGGSCRRR